jgi:hypothetical protein
MKRAVGLALVFFAACGGGGKEVASKYPPQPEGCPVQLVKGTPSVPTDNIGVVTATCGAEAPAEQCLRELQDQACKLGADILWGVPDGPEMKFDKQFWSARAAHTK